VILHRTGYFVTADISSIVFLFKTYNRYIIDSLSVKLPKKTFLDNL